MSNIVYDEKLFNEQIKNEFSKDFNPATKGSINRIFKVSAKSEFDLSKDLYSFNREQIRKILFLFAPKTENSSKLNTTWIIRYLDWAIENNYLKGMSPLHGITKDWHKQFVNTKIKKYWTDVELEHIISNLSNAQDAVIIKLLFEGAKGTANTEITNLTKKNVNSFNNTLELYDSETGVRRTITVSDKCIRMCEAAKIETEYDKKNGNVSPDLIANPVAQLVDNSFLIRSSKTRLYRLEEADKNIVHRRLKMISVEIEEQYFSPMHLFYSGMIFMAKESYLENGELDDEDYEKIFKQFGETSDQVKHRIKEEVLSLENIKEVYGLS